MEPKPLASCKAQEHSSAFGGVGGLQRNFGKTKFEHQKTSNLDREKYFVEMNKYWQKF